MLWQFADRAGIFPTLLGRIERSGDQDARMSSTEKIRMALVAAGIEFVNHRDGFMAFWSTVQQVRTP